MANNNNITQLEYIICYQLLLKIKIPWIHFKQILCFSDFRLVSTLINNIVKTVLKKSIQNLQK